jgi:hypothetical protein
VFFTKKSEKASEEKSSEKPSEEKPVEKPSGEKPSEQPQPKPKLKLVRFHCGYCGRDVHKDEFCFKRKREERIAKEWAYKDKYHPPNSVLEPRLQMPRAKASVRTVPAWGERKDVGGAGLDRQQFLFHARIGARFGSGGRGSGGWAGEYAGGQFARHSPRRAQYGNGRSCSFELERRDGGRVSFRVLDLLQLERAGSLVVVFVEVALVGKMFWIVLTALSSKWLGTGFTLLVLTLVLSRLLAHVLVFEFQVGDLKNIWLIDSSCSRHMT